MYPYAVATRMGFIMPTGEVGLGKTTVIRAVLEDRNRIINDVRLLWGNGYTSVVKERLSGIPFGTP